MLLLTAERDATAAPCSAADAVRLLHRADDSRVQLSRKDPSGRWHDRIRELEAADVHRQLPDVLGRYPADLFYRVNSVPTRTRPGYFNAAFADLDVQDVGMKEGEAMERLTDAHNRGVIPQPSIVAGSGRGLWVYWHLLDPATGKPPEWSGPKKLVYRRVQEAINGRLTDLGAEAKDAERYTRVPGSVNGKSGQPVRYWPQYGGDGQVLAYTMEDLSAFFGTDSVAPEMPADAKPAPSAFNAEGWAKKLTAPIRSDPRASPPRAVAPWCSRRRATRSCP